MDTTTGLARLDLLGFTHYWGLSFKGKYWVIKLKTAARPLQSSCSPHRSLVPRQSTSVAL